MKEKEFQDRAAIEVLAAWWTERLTKRTKFDNGDGDPRAGMMASMIGDKLKPLTEGQIIDFKMALLDALEQLYEAGFRIKTSVDYDPRDVLAVAGEVASIDDLKYRLPWKTSAWIDDGKVFVAEGYGADVEEILIPKELVQRLIDDRRDFLQDQYEDMCRNGERRDYPCICGKHEKRRKDYMLLREFCYHTKGD